jgi:hypothetical protein
VFDENEWKIIQKKLQKTKISVARDSIINAFNTAKQMIAIKTSQNIIRRSKAHTFLTTRIVNRESLILIVWLSPWKKKESRRHNQFSLPASSVSILFDFLLIVSHLHFFLLSGFWQISRRRQRIRLWLRDSATQVRVFGLMKKQPHHTFN